MCPTAPGGRIESLIEINIVQFTREAGQLSRKMRAGVAKTEIEAVADFGSKGVDGNAGRTASAARSGAD